MEMLTSVSTHQPEQSQLSEACLDSTAAQWTSTINTLTYFALLSCVRLYKLPGCQGPYKDYQPGSIVSKKNIANSQSLRAYSLTENHGKMRKRRSLRTEISRRKKSRMDYLFFKVFFKMNYPKLYEKFKENVHRYFEKPDNWTFYLNKTVNGRRQQYIEVLRNIFKFYHKYTADVVKYNLTDDWHDRHVHFVLLELAQALRTIDPFLEKREAMLYWHKIDIGPKVPYTFHSSDLMWNINRRLRKALKIINPDTVIRH